MENAFGKGMRSVLEYLRRAVTPIFINLMFGMTMLAVSAISITELKILLMVALVALTFLASFLLMRSMGEYAYKMKVAGARKRAGQPVGMGLETGKDTYHSSKEYRSYKGFVIGAVVCIIPVIFIIVDICTGSGGARLAYGMLAGWALMPVLAISTKANILFSLIPCAIQIVVSGIAYILGGGREKVRQFALEQRAESVAKTKGAKKG